MVVGFAFCHCRAVELPSEDELAAQPIDDRFSTNWLAAVRAALPTNPFEKGVFDFQAATNGLAGESAKGNLAAQALWGVTLLVLHASPETTATGLEWLRGSADKGCIPAMLNLGYMSEEGKYVRKNYDEGFHWFEKAAELGNAEAQLQLGACYHYGLGTTPNLAMTAKYYQLAAGQTNYVAMKSLGYLLMNGYGVDKNEDEAKVWFLRAATEGRNRRAMYNLGVIYSEKFPDTNSTVESFKWMKQSAELGDPLAAEQLALFYLRGWGGIQTNAAAYHFWRLKAAFLGATDSQFFMGQAYRLGDGVAKNVDQSMFWYDKAAAKNHPSALYDLALHYLEDRTNRASLMFANQLMLRAAQMGHREAQCQCALTCFRDALQPDCSDGKDWLEKAAENGWPRAEFCLFQFYYNGLKPGKDCTAYPVDKIEGLKWLRRAADHGNLFAQSILAVMLIRGVDVEQNLPEAGKLLRNAAEHGAITAQNDLGYAILNGDIVSADPTEAAMWCKLALTHSSDQKLSTRFQVNLSNALARLTPDQQQEVDDRVKSFKPQPVPQMDPKMDGWQKNPDYRAENGQFSH
jgi:TPR repeat protein